MNSPVPHQRNPVERALSNRSRNMTKRPTRLRELARLRSLHIQPLSPSSQSQKSIKENKFIYEDPVDVDDVSISMSPSHLAVETRLPTSALRVNTAEHRYQSPNRLSHPLSPSQGIKTILDSPRMKNLRKQHQQGRSRGSTRDSVSESLRRARHYRRSVSISRERAAEERNGTDMNKTTIKTDSRHQSTGKANIVNRASVAISKTQPTVKSSAVPSLQRARRYRRSISNTKERSNQNVTAPAVSTPKASNARARTRLTSKSSSKAKAMKDSNKTDMNIELNDSDIFTDFHLVMMATSSSDDSSLATNSSSGSKSSAMSWRQRKLMGRKFKSISSTTKPSHHSIISKLVAQKKKNIHIPISQLCQCVVPIQTLARVFLAKLSAVKRMEGIIVVQSLIRRWKSQRYLSACQFISIRLQACHRGYIAREEAIILHAQTFVAKHLQSSYRGSIVRTALRCQGYSATRIQALWRGYYEYLVYGDVKNSTLVIQSVARMWCQRKMFLFVQDARRALEAQILAAQLEEATIKIQTAWRALEARVNFFNTIIDVVIIQSIIRRWSGNKRVKKMLTEHRAATKLQSCFRGQLAYLNWRRVLYSVILIQTHLRRTFALKELEQLRVKRHELQVAGATKIAAQWRRFNTRIIYLNTLIDIIICQSAARRHNAVKRAQLIKQHREERRQACATLIQRAWKESCIREAQSKHTENLVLILSNMDFLKTAENTSAILIAAFLRRFVCELNYERLVSDVVTCQSVVRRYLVAKNKALKRKAFAIICQSMIRRNLAMKKARHMKHLVIKAQVLENVRFQSIINSSATTRIARMWRHKFEMNTKEVAATKISSQWRGYITRIVCVEIFIGIILFQSQVRRMMAAKQFELLRQKRMESHATKIQASWRSYTAVIRFTWTIYDIVIVQSVVRRWIAQRRVDILQEENCQVQIEAITKIQAQWRGFSDYRDYMILLGDVILCQSVFRRHSAMKIAQEKKQAWQQARDFLQIIFNMKQLGEIEQASARKIEKTWKQARLRRSVKTIKVLRKIYGQRLSY